MVYERAHFAENDLSVQDARATSLSPSWFRRTLLLIAALALLLAPTGAYCLQGEQMNASRVRLLWSDDDLLVLEGGMTIDADGAPHAYSPVPDEGLDALEHAGSAEGGWNGIATRDGEPIIQGPDEPAPGFYVSTTALEIHAYPPERQEHYVNANHVPYIALPATDDGPRLGDLAFVVNTRTHKTSPAIFADISDIPGEGSIALARRLGINADARRGGTGGGIVYFVFHNSGSGTLPAADDMAQQVQELWSSPAVQDVWSGLCSEHPDWSCEDVMNATP